MRGPALLTVALVLVAAVVAVPVSGLTPTTADGTPVTATAPSSLFQQNETTQANESDTDTFAPGERLAGVIGVQGAEVRGEVASRAYGHRISGTNDERTQARVVATEYNDSRERLDALKQRKQTLTRAHENGSLSTGAYRARLAQLTAQIRTVERIVNQTEAAAATLPPQALERHGVNATEIRRLHTDARNLTGPDGAAAARAVAGAAAGRGMARGPPKGTPPGHSGETGQSKRGGQSNESGQSKRGGQSNESGQSKRGGQSGDPGQSGQANRSGNGPGTTGPHANATSEAGNGSSENAGNGSSKNADDNSSENAGNGSSENADDDSSSASTKENAAGTSERANNASDPGDAGANASNGSSPGNANDSDAAGTQGDRGDGPRTNNATDSSTGKSDLETVGLGAVFWQLT